MKRDDPAVVLARDWARFYRSLGYNPLPSRRDKKVPAMRTYAWERDHGLPESAVEHWWSSNIQLACGARWSLVVVDLDGDEAVAQWERLGSGEPSIRTWVVVTRERAGARRGMHLWFDPQGEPVATRLISGEWDATANRFRKRSQIELKGEKALIMAPPSIHPETGRPYSFLPGCSPVEILRPAPLPAWVRELPSLRPPRSVSELIPLCPQAPRKPVLAPWAHYDRHAVLQAIPDKLALAASWGLRIEGGPNSAGWCPCHALGRPDEHPSASFHVTSGYYCEPDGGGGSLVRHSLYELGALIGPYATWLDCLDDLAILHHVPLAEKSRVG